MQGAGSITKDYIINITGYKDYIINIASYYSCYADILSFTVYQSVDSVCRDGTDVAEAWKTLLKQQLYGFVGT